MQSKSHHDSGSLQPAKGHQGTDARVGHPWRAWVPGSLKVSMRTQKARVGKHPSPGRCRPHGRKPANKNLCSLLRFQQTMTTWRGVQGRQATWIGKDPEIMPSWEKLEDLKTRKLFLVSSKLSCGRHVRLTLSKSGAMLELLCYFGTSGWGQTRKHSHKQKWPGLRGRSSEGAPSLSTCSHTAVGSLSSSEAGVGGSTPRTVHLPILNLKCLFCSGSEMSKW